MKIRLKKKIWLRHAARVVLVGMVIFFVGMLLRREIDRGWAGIFSIGQGKLDILPLAAAVFLLGVTYGKTGLRLAAQGILVAVVFLYLGSTIHRDWGQITRHPWNFSPFWVAAWLLLMFSLYLCYANGWLLILKQFGHSVPRLPGSYVWGKSLLARYVPGNMLMVVGRVIMIERFGVPKRISLASVIYEQALMAASAATVVSIALPLWPELRAISPFIWLVLLVPPLAIAGLHPSFLGRVGNFVLTKIGREPIQDFLSFKAVLVFIGYYCTTWTIAGLGLFSLVSAVTTVGFRYLPLVVASVPLAWLVAMMVFISPSGLGVREGVYAYTLGFAFNHEAGVASAFAILARFWQTMMEIFFVLTIMTVTKKLHPKSGEARQEAETEEAPEEEALSGP